MEDGAGEGGRERPGAGAPERGGRQARLAAAMRANLRRRKEQRRAREVDPPAEASAAAAEPAEPETAVSRPEGDGGG